MQRLLAAGCACALAALTVGAAAQEPETITLRYWGSEADALTMDLLQDYENVRDGSDGRPRIKIMMGQTATINPTNDPQRLLCSIAGGDPPDAVWFDRYAVGEWASRGAFVSLQSFYEDDLAERPDEPFTLHEEDFWRPCWEEANYEGELFAVPAGTDNRALYYNIDMLEKYADELIAAGCVDPDDPSKVGPPRTWEQLKAATEIMTERDEKGRLIQVGFIPMFGNSWLYIYGWLNGGMFLSEDGRTSLLDSEEIVEALAFIVELYELMGGAKAVGAFEQSQQGAELDPFLAGKVAMKIDGDAYITAIANLRPTMRFGVTLPPAPPGGKRLGWSGGFAYIIPSGAKHQREAWEFVKYLASRRAYGLRMEAGRQASNAIGGTYIPEMSGRKDLTRWSMREYLYDDPAIPEKFKEAKRVFVESMPFAKYRPVTPVGQLMWNEQIRAVDQALRPDGEKERKLSPMERARRALEARDAVVQRELDETFGPKEGPVVPWTPVVLGYLGLVGIACGVIYWYFNRRMHASGYFRREYYAGYAFAAPWFFGFVTLGGGPFLFSLIMSFCEYDIFSVPRFIGFGNYARLFSGDPLVYKSLWNSVFMVISVPVSMALGLGIALLLNHNVKGMAVYRTFFYLPVIMPAVAASILWIWIFNPQQGILNAMLSPILEIFGAAPPAWLNDADWSKPAIVLMMLWTAGGQMIIWLAGLKGIPSHLYEAAKIDGAGPFRRFRSITLPMLSPYILFNFVMGFIATFQVFAQAYIMTQGGPVDSTLFYVYYIFNNAFRYMRMGYASALAWILFLIIFVLTVFQLYMSRKWVHYETE